MTEHDPRIRIRARNGHVVLREGLNICFYLRHAHAEVAQKVRQSLDTFQGVVGAGALDRFADTDGDWHPLDAAGWRYVHEELQADDWALVRLRSESPEGPAFGFEYHGKTVSDVSMDEPGAVTALGFWLPTEALESLGPQRIRELAIELAKPLPFCFGHAGLSFNGELDLVGVDHEVDLRRFRHPGLDVFDLGALSWKLGTRVRGPSWLTFLGQPVLDQLDGAAGLRSRLGEEHIQVDALDPHRVVITLGESPEAGDVDQGHTLPAYRALARVLEPWTYREEHLHGSGEETQRRWERRFLD